MPLPSYSPVSAVSPIRHSPCRYGSRRGTRGGLRTLMPAARCEASLATRTASLNDTGAALVAARAALAFNTEISAIPILAQCMARVPAKAAISSVRRARDCTRDASVYGQRLDADAPAARTSVHIGAPLPRRRRERA